MFEQAKEFKRERFEGKPQGLGLGAGGRGD